MISPAQKKSRKSSKGFTLAEVLITLALIGVIATITLPKLLVAQQDQKKMAIFKESVGAMQAGVFDQVRQGNVLLGISGCGVSNATASLTLSETFMNYLNETNSITILLANGSTISHHRGAGLDYTFDWNGTDSPNVEGDDQLILTFRCANNPARFVPTTTSATMYSTIFQ